MQSAEAQTLWRLLSNLFNIRLQRPKYTPPLHSDLTPPTPHPPPGLKKSLGAPPKVTVQMCLATGFDYFQLGAVPGGNFSGLSEFY